MDQPGSNRVAAKKQSPPVVAAPKSVEPMVAAGDIGPITAYEQLASLSADGRPDPAHVLALQRAAGNRAVSRFMAGRTIQTKVNTDPAAGRSASEPAQRARGATPIPAPGPGRREAGRSRARPAASPPASPVRPPIAQRIARLDDEEMPGVPAPQPGAGFDASPDFESRLASARGSGAPLPDTTRAFMEQRIGADFGGVKVHTDARSDALNQAIQAKAFTTGQDVFFRQGEFEPATSGGKELIAHELTHVVQQTGAAMRASEPEAPVSIARTSAGQRTIQADGDGNTSRVPTPTEKDPSPTVEPHMPTLEEELIAEGVADTTTFAGPAQIPGRLAKLGARMKAAVAGATGSDPVKIAIDKLDRAALDRIIDLISKEQLECAPQHLSWLGQRNSVLQADPGSYETTLANELAWEKAASIAVLDRPGMERILRLIRDNKLKVKPGELQQLGQRSQALMADASTYATTLAKELAFEQVEGISELDRDGLDRILTLIEDGKLMITPAERQSLGKRRVQVGGASTPGAITLKDALAREGVDTIAALDFEGVERVLELLSEKKLTLAPAQLQQLGRRRSELEATGNKASKLGLDAALAREGVETIGQLDLLGVDAITDLIREHRLDVTLRQKQQLGERRQQLLRSAKTVTRYLKDKLAAEVAGGTQTKGTRIKPISKLTEPECEAILELVGRQELRATNQEIHDLSRFHKTKPAERERYETTFEEQLAWEGATKVDQLSVEAAERIRELVAENKLKVTTAQLQQLARLSKAKPAPGAEKTTLEKELARHGAATIDALDLEGVEAIRRLDQEKKLDLGPDDQREIGRRYRLLQSARKTDETTLEIEMAREGLGAREFDKLDLDGAQRILGLVEAGTLTLETATRKLETATILALGQQRNRQKSVPGDHKTNLELEMARHGATKIEELDLDGVEAILELTAAAEPMRLEVPAWMLRGLGQRRRTLLKERETKKPTLADELKIRAATGIDDLELEALDEINELLVDGKLKLLPSEREHLERRRKQQREAANAGKPKLEALLAWEGAETIAELDFNAVDKILGQIRYDGLTVEAGALRELVRRRNALAVADIATGTLDEELANEGALKIADLDAGGVDRIWDLVESGKLEVTNERLLELARRRKEYSAETKTLETSIAKELAREDVDGISDLDFAGVRRIWKLVERAALEISPDQLRELAQRRKAMLSEPRTYETTLAYELARAKANTIADLDMSEVSNILELAEAGDLALSNADLAQLVRRQKEEAYDGRALKALLADRKDRSIGSLTPLTVSILWSLAEQKKLRLSADQRRELTLRRRDQAANPGTLETELERENAKTIAGLTTSAANRIWLRVIEQEIALKPVELANLAKRAGKDKRDAQAYAEKETTRLGQRLSAFETQIPQQKGMRRLSVTQSEKPDDQDSDAPLDILDIPPSLFESLSSYGVTKISDLSYAAAEDIIGQIEAGRFGVTNDELRQLVRLRNEERKLRESEATTFEQELNMEGVTTIAELDLEGAERIWDLVSAGFIAVEIERRRELAKRRATLLSPRKPEVLNLTNELANEGAVEIASLDAAGLERISTLVQTGDLDVTPAQLRQLVQRRKELQGPRKTLVEELAAEGVAAITDLDFEGVKRIIGLAEGSELKVEAGQLRQLYWREEKLNRDPVERITLVKELIRAQADSIAALDLGGVEGIIALIERGALKVDVEQLRELYQLDARLSEGELDDTEQGGESILDEAEDEKTLGTTSQSEANSGLSEPFRRTRSNAIVGSSLGAELVRVGVSDIDSLDLLAAQRLIGLIEDGRLKALTSQRRQLYRRQSKLTNPETLEGTTDDLEMQETLEVLEESGPDQGTKESGGSSSRRGTLGRKNRNSLLDVDARVPTGRQRSNAILGRNPLEADFALVLAREGVKDIASLDLAGAERIRARVANGELSLTTSDAAALAARLRELVRVEELGQVPFENALAREDATGIADLDLDGVERIRELLTTNKIKPMPGNDALLQLGQQRNALLSKQNQGRTTLQAELDREKAGGISDLDLRGVERIRGLLAQKKLELTRVEMLELAQRRTDLLSKGGPGEPTLKDELALEGVETIEELDLEGVNRIRSLIAAEQLTVEREQLNALGKRRMALLASPNRRKTTLEAELALEGAAKIADLDTDAVSRIRRLVEEDRLDISAAQLKELGLRSETLPPEPEPALASLEVELAREGVSRIADLGLAGVTRIRRLVNDKYGEPLKVTDKEAEELRQHKERLSEKVTLSAFLDRVGAPSIAGLDREAMIDIWKLVEDNKLNATDNEIREIAIKRRGLRVEVMKLSEYLADKRNAPDGGLFARTIDSLNAKEIGAILSLIEDNRLTAEPGELEALARRRKELRHAPKLDPSTLSEALIGEGPKAIARLGLDEIQELWKRVAQRELEATSDERKELGQRRRELLRESRTLKGAVASTGAASIADLALGDVLDLWDRVAEGALSAEPEERKQLGERRKSRIGGARTLAFELEKEGAKDIASLDADAVERIWELIEGDNLMVSTDALRELSRRHNYETGYDVRIRTLEALADLTGEGPARPTVQTKLSVGPVNDRYEQEADRVARQVVRAPEPVQPQLVDEYYSGPAYPSSAKRSRTQRSIQAKLTVGPVGDRYEQEADRVARQVVAMRMPAQTGDEYYSGSAYRPRGTRGSSSPAPIQQALAPIEKADLQARALAQRSGAAFDAGADFEAGLGAARTGGVPLPDSTRAFMEQRMGADFGGVRVHADAQSGQLNRMIQAKAFTTGSDVFFGRGEYNPDSASGKELLAHELAHTVQQGAAPVQRRIPHIEAPEAAAKEPDEAGVSAPWLADGQTDPGALRRAEEPSAVGAPADTREDTRSPIATETKRPVIQRHLLGGLAGLGRTLLSSLASIPENLWAALRPATGVARTLPGLPASLETPPPSLALEEEPVRSEARVVSPPTIDQPAAAGEALTPESIRATVNLFDPTGGDVVRYISDRITEVGTVKDLLFVVSRERLVDALANDMAARSGRVPVDESHQQAAEREVANGGGGFTALDGRIFILDTAAQSSALFHEVIHVLSGPGGATPLAQLKMQLNEGFTNYFAEEVAGLVGGAVYAAYAFPTEWARKFAAAHGQDAAYNIYFKGNIDLLYEKIAGFLLKQARENQLKESEANLLKLRGEWSMDKALAMVKAKVKGADFFDKNALPNLWFDGRVF